MPFLFFFIYIFFISCNTIFQKSIKSNDPNLILNISNDFFKKKEYTYSSSLYEYLVPLVKNTNLLPEVLYKLAESNFKLKKYNLSSVQFENFYLSFKEDPRAEEALYLSIFSYYKNSDRSNLDQTNTNKAINKIQNFINLYPNSIKVNNCILLIKSLQEKLIKKTFFNALTLYKIGKYKASNIAFDNIVLNFSNSLFKEEAYYYSILSKYEIAKNSILSLKTERIIQTINSINLFLIEYPNSKFRKKIKDINIQLNLLLKII